MKHGSIAHEVTGAGGRLPESLAAATPGATIKIREGCGHVMFYERPRRVQPARDPVTRRRRRRRSITSNDVANP